MKPANYLDKEKVFIHKKFESGIQQGLLMIEYNPDSGLFTNESGADVGNYGSKDGYVYVQFEGSNWLAHRLAFLFMTGSVPDVVDHKDCIRRNNVWENLRPCTTQQNNLNSSVHFDSKSGIKGVYWHMKKKRWIAKVSIHGKQRTLGAYTFKHEAAKAVCDARAKYHGEFARN